MYYMCECFLECMYIALADYTISFVCDLYCERIYTCMFARQCVCLFVYAGFKFVLS